MQFESYEKGFFDFDILKPNERWNNEIVEWCKKGVVAAITKSLLFVLDTHVLYIGLSCQCISSRLHADNRAHFVMNEGLIHRESEGGFNLKWKYVKINGMSYAVSAKIEEENRVVTYEQVGDHFIDYFVAWNNFHKGISCGVVVKYFLKKEFSWNSFHDKGS